MCTSLNVAHYADDSKVYMIGDSFDSLIRKIDFELGKIDYSLCANKFFFSEKIQIPVLYV